MTCTSPKLPKVFSQWEETLEKERKQGTNKINRETKDYKVRIKFIPIEKRRNPQEPKEHTYLTIESNELNVGNRGVYKGHGVKRKRRKPWDINL